MRKPIKQLEMLKLQLLQPNWRSVQMWKPRKELVMQEVQPI